jgi:predicted RNase H-like nuclease (RuvC/YqgF family)
MLFSLSEDFYESGGDLYRQKFGSLEKSMIQISKKTEDISSKCEFNEEKISDLNKQLDSNNSIIFKLFKKNNVKKEISVLEIELLERHQELQVLKNDMDTVTSLERIEEYIKILGIILEVCIFPARFAWAIEN